MWHEELTNNNRSWQGKVLNWITSHWLNLLFILCLVFTLVAPLMLAFLGKATEAGIVAGAGFICMAFTQLDKFAEFSGLGFKGKMREMERAKDEAYASIEAMRELAKALTSLSMEGLIGTGRGGGRPWKVSLGLRRKVHGILLEKLGMSRSEANEAVKIFDHHMETMLACDIQKAIRNSTELDKQGIEQLLGKSIVDHAMRKAAPTETFWELARKFNVADEPEVIECLEDLAYYREHHELRRPKTWAGEEE